MEILNTFFGVYVSRLQIGIYWPPPYWKRARPRENGAGRRGGIRALALPEDAGEAIFSGEGGQEFPVRQVPNK